MNCVIKFILVLILFKNSSYTSNIATSTVKKTSKTEITEKSTYHSHHDKHITESSTSAHGSLSGESMCDVSKNLTESAAVAGTSSKQTTYNEDDEPKLWNNSMKSSSTYLQLASRPRQK